MRTNTYIDRDAWRKCVDQISANLATMQDLSRTAQRGTDNETDDDGNAATTPRCQLCHRDECNHINPNTIRPPHGHSDPTGDSALIRTGSQQWLDEVRSAMFQAVELFRRTQALAAQGVDICGHNITVCPHCRRPIIEDDVTAKSGGETWHRKCYRAHMWETTGK